LFRYFDDLEDLNRVAIARQFERVRQLAVLDLSCTGALAERVARLVRSRLRAYDEIGSVGIITRIRAPFRPLIAEQLRQARAMWRSQLQQLFAPEFAAMNPVRVDGALAAADVLGSFESVQLMRDDQGLSPECIEAALIDSITRILEN
jgi:AcrR family transcriptional regulator